VIADDGVGMSSPDPAASGGLGTQIVRTFVTGELHGSIEWKARKGGGTRVVVKVQLH
jgi:two-component sensor histidine kinase